MLVSFTIKSGGDLDKPLNLTTALEVMRSIGATWIARSHDLLMQGYTPYYSCYLVLFVTATVQMNIHGEPV